VGKISNLHMEESSNSQRDLGFQNLMTTWYKRKSMSWDNKFMTYRLKDEARKEMSRTKYHMGHTSNSNS
jgi:hypothetical protein